MHCPRCKREGPDGAAFCGGCGAPLALRDEPAPRPLEVTLPLDRRRPGGREPPDAEAPAADDPPWAAPTPPAPAAPRGPVGSAFAASPPARGEPPGSPRTPAAVAAALGKPLAPPPLPRRPPIADASGWDLGRTLADPDAEPGALGLAAGAAEVGLAPPVRAASLVPEPEVGVLEVHLRRAEPWRRVLAWAIDLVPLALIAGAIVRPVLGGVSLPAGGVDGLLDLVARERALLVPLAAFLALLALVYGALSHTLMGATLGKWVAGLRVVGRDGRRPRWKRSAIRSVLSAVSLAALGMGCLLALFTRSGRALHDLVAGTYVVRAP